MALPTIRIPDEGKTRPDALDKTPGTAETQMVRPALRPVFEDSFMDRKTIVLPLSEYQALADLIGTPLTPQEIEGRKRLENVPDWELS